MSDLTDDQVRALLDGATENAYDLEVVKWGGGIRCVYLNDYRVAGEKPWGGGDTTRRFKVRMADIMRAFRGTVQAAAPDLARALLDARAELDQARADAQAAVALVVEQAADIADDPDIPAKWLKRNAIRALAPADGLATVDALRAEIADLKMNMDADLRTMVREGQQLRTLAAELAAAQQREAGLVERAEKAEAERDKWFEGAGAHHVASMQQAQRADIAEAELARLRDRERVLVEAATPYVQPVQNADYGRQLRQHEALVAALAPTPTDPGDGWTWNERLGWIGPDGKPADPRRRG